jgi:hypothetical protein
MMTLTFDSVLRESESGFALLFDFGKGKREWIPKSQIKELVEPAVAGDSGTALVPEWLVLEKGLEAFAEEY